MKKIKVVFLFILILSTNDSVYSQQIHSQVESKSIKSTVLNAEREYTIYLPKNYNIETDKKYPILYLLHGMNGTNNDWFGRGHLQEVLDLLISSNEACEMIVVSPNAGGDISKGIWNGYFDMPGWKYETFFFTEFLPYIESTYRVIQKKQSRAIAGFSMGGGGATNYAQRHSEMFSAAYAMSALMSIPKFRMDEKNNPEDKFSILTRSVIENSCIEYIQKAEEKQKQELNSVRWFIDCGDDDFLLDRNIEFIQAMQKKGIPCEFRVRDGGHTWEYWHSALYMCLKFVSRTFSK